ncbi:MAG: DUF2339 domain-containing protein [Pseudomonadota bacterium]
MEFAGLAILAALFFILCPIIALVSASKANGRVERLEKLVEALKTEMMRMRSELVSNQEEQARGLKRAATAADTAARAAERAAAAVNAPPAAQAATPTSPDAAADRPPELAPPLADMVLPAARAAHASMIEAQAHSAVPTPTRAQVDPTQSDAPDMATPEAQPHTERASAAQAARRPPPAPAAAPAPPAPPPAWLLAAKEWLTGGNLVAKLGLLILFIGVSFLLKYAAARVTVPIELRLAGVVLADIALLLWGWRIRETRRGISLPVQGAALAILMLTTFGAFRLYHLIPGGMAFALLFLLTMFTCLLAVLQDAIWLALFGIAGGFAAPIVTSTGGGSHIGLFSYYALLNAGVFGIAIKRSWRALNLLGFVFTFVIGTSWGVLRYVPENYLSVQLFLILFFAFYVAIAMAYAARQAPRLKHYVDGTLVFGTPLLAFGLQYGLVKDVKFGLAFSALALGLFYTGLASAIWRRRGGTFKLLAESFLALGIVFATLAVPFALDGRWTSAAWALEGAGIVWVGLRQRQTMTWAFGLLVQAGAWLSFLGAVSGLDAAAAARSNLWLGFLLLAGTAFLMATKFRAHQRADDAAPSVEFPVLATGFLVFAAVWLVAGAWTEICLHAHGALRADLLVLTALGCAVGLGLIARRMQWGAARTLALLVQGVAGLVLFGLVVDQLNWATPSADLFDGPFLSALLITSGALFSSWTLFGQAREDGGANMAGLSRVLLAWGAVWWFALVLQPLSGWAAVQYAIYVGRGMLIDEWLAAYATLAALTALAFAHGARRLQWAPLRWLSASSWVLLALVTFGIVGGLYTNGEMPIAAIWWAYAALWLASEYLLRMWPAAGWTIRPSAMKLLHSVRTAGPWLMIWPVAGTHIARWLDGATPEQKLAWGLEGSGSWARYLPMWLMMLAIAALLRRSRAETASQWPVAPLAPWYRRWVIPMGAAWSLLLIGVWNFSQNGAMAPLPYAPLLNPLDLTSCFALLLLMACWRMFKHDGAMPALTARLPLAAACAAYAWFNLMLLRTVAHYRAIHYGFDALFASQFVQAMLSLVWSVTALILMRRAARRGARTGWTAGAVLLGVVVAKLFLVDLSNVGGVERIITFLGVGALMVAIGYVAPFPGTADKTEKEAA